MYLLHMRDCGCSDAKAPVASLQGLARQRAEASRQEGRRIFVANMCDPSLCPLLLFAGLQASPHLMPPPLASTRLPEPPADESSCLSPACTLPC